MRSPPGTPSFIKADKVQADFQCPVSQIGTHCRVSSFGQVATRRHWPLKPEPFLDGGQAERDAT
jgi:hypothetical protein